MSKFEFKKGSRVKGVSADVAGNELARIYQQEQQLKPAKVVDESRPEAAPLHPVFEWDDKVAAEKHREDQARHLIRSVRVINPYDEKQERTYVHVKSLESYQPVEKVAKSVNLYLEAWRDAVQRVEQAQFALEHLESVAGVLHQQEIKVRTRQLAELVLWMESQHDHEREELAAA